MRGHHQRDQLVAQLLVGHPGVIALVIARREQHREQIAVIARLGAALLDQPMDERVHAAARAVQLAHPRNRRVLEQHPHRKNRAIEHAHRQLERLGHVVRIAVDVGIEQRAPRDRERHAHHLLVHIELLVRVPVALEPLGELRHRRAVAREPLLVKGRLDEPALAQMVLALAREQPLAQQHLRHLERASLHERLLLAHEHRLDVIRMREQRDALRARA